MHLHNQELPGSQGRGKRNNKGPCPNMGDVEKWTETGLKNLLFVGNTVD